MGKTTRVGTPRPPKTTSPASRPAPAATPAPMASTPSKPADGLDLSAPVSAVAGVFDRALDRDFVEGKDGFISYDPATLQIGAGHAAGATVRDAHLSAKLLDPLLRVLAGGEKGDKVQFTLGGETVDSAATAKNGETSLPGSLLQSALGALDPKRGGVLQVGVRAADAPKTADAHILALPKDYDGPIFVSDIDDTLRPTKITSVLAGRVQDPIPGAQPLLQQVADLGVPIVYLSAGTSRIHQVNEAFLEQFPKGVLLDNDKFGLADLTPSNTASAQRQASYKEQVLADLKAAYPNAKIFGIGDDKYGDAMAYAQAGATAYIHNVSPDQHNVPTGFTGVISDDYTPAFQSKVVSDLKGALAQSESFGGDPAAPVTTLPGPANPTPNHGKLMDEVRTYAKLFDKVPAALDRGVHEALANTSDAVDQTRALTDAQLAQLPPATLAGLADDLLETHGVTELVHHASAEERTSQLARVLSARGTAPGGPDAILTLMDHAKDIAARTAGPDSAKVIALSQPTPATPGDWKGFESFVDVATHTVERPGTKVEPLIDGATAFPAMLSQIDTAKSSVDLTIFAFQSDSAGWDYARHLAAAADRGAKVRVMFDPFGSLKSQGQPTDPGIFRFLEQHGVEVRCFPPGAMGDHLTHRKILVVDGQTGFVGGMNIGDQYRDEWHDVHSRVTGPGVADLQHAFVDQWKGQGGQLSPADEKALFPTLAPVANSSARVIPHVGTADESMKLAYLRAIDTAAKTIRIANPYLSDPDVMDHLIAAARRGVDVRLVVPQVNDSGPEQAIERSWYNALSAAGAKVYEYPDRMAHDKVATFDGTVSTIGSSNLDARSLDINDECNVWSPEPAVAQDINQRLFDHDLGISRQVTEYKPGLFRSMWDDLLRKVEGTL